MKQQWIEQIKKKASLLEIDEKPAELLITEQQAKQLYQYMELLLHWNQKMNLTALTEPSEIMTKHFLDSAAGKGFLSPGRVADIGTGAGFPGVVLKILEPERPFILMDALQKRLNFLNEVCEAMKLTQVEIIHERAEDAGQKQIYRQQYDTAVSRAVAPMPVLLEYCIPLLKTGGVFLAYKGPGLREELEQSEKAISILGCQVEGIHSVRVQGEDWQHWIAVIRKVKPTHPLYPRRQAKIKKEPL